MAKSALPTKRDHQTVVFVRQHPADLENDRYVERNKRLIGSLNGSNIKADVFTVRGSDITPGLNVEPAGPAELPASVRAQLEKAGYDAVPVGGTTSDFGPRISSPELRAIADKAGYTQAIIVSGSADA